MKIVALDFDETISDNETGWLRVMKTLESIGYQCIVVTYRRPDAWPEDLQFLVDHGYKVYFTGQEAKRHFLVKLGIKVDIWIDDSPETITHSLINYKFQLPEGTTL